METVDANLSGAVHGDQVIRGTGYCPFFPGLERQSPVPHFSEKRDFWLKEEDLFRNTAGILNEFSDIAYYCLNDNFAEVNGNSGDQRQRHRWVQAAGLQKE